MFEILEIPDQKEQNKDIEVNNRKFLEKVKTEVVDSNLTKAWLNELKSESMIYFDSLYDNTQIGEKFPQFNKEKFKKLCMMIDENGKLSNIPQPYNDLLKWVALSESSMNKEVGDVSRFHPIDKIKSKWTKEELEQTYVYPELRELYFWWANPLFNLQAKIWSRARGKAYDIHNRYKEKSAWQNALGPFQMQTSLFTRLICSNKLLSDEAIQIIQNHLWSHPGSKQIIAELQKTDSIDDKTTSILHNKEMLNVMQRMSYNSNFAQKVAYEFIKNNEQTFKNNYKSYKVYLDPNDLLLTCGLAHLKGPQSSFDAILQQNLYLIAQSLGIEVSSIIWTWKPFQIDGAIKLEGKETRLVKDKQDPDPKAKTLEEYSVWGGETWKLYQAIKTKLSEQWIRSLETVELQDIMGSKGPDCRNNMIQRLQDTEKQLQEKWVQYNFEPLLSVCDLKPLQDSGKIHLRYIFHYLNSLQCDPNTEKMKKVKRWKVTVPWPKEGKSDWEKHNSNKSDTRKETKPKTAKVEKWTKDWDKGRKENETHNKTNKSDENSYKNDDLKFWRFRKQYADFNEQWELEKGNMSWLNWIKFMYSKPWTKKISSNGDYWDGQDIENNTRLSKVVTYKDIFNNHIKSESTMVFDQEKRNDSDYISSCIKSLLEQAWWEKENIILWFRKAAKVVDIIKDENGNFKDIMVALPLFDKALGRHTIQKLAVFGDWGLMSLYKNVYACVLK